MTDDAIDKDSLEDEMEDTLEEIEAELREAQEEDEAAFERDVDGMLEGDTSGAPAPQAGEDASAAEELAAGESSTFQEWVRRCQQEHRHCYATDILTGRCTCPDNSTVGYICKHLFRGLQISGKTMRDLPSSVVNAAHLSNDLEACEEAGRTDDRTDTVVVNPTITSSPDEEQEDAPPPPSPSPSPRAAASPSTSPSTAGDATPESGNLHAGGATRQTMQSQIEQRLKVLTSYAHAEMPDEVYSTLWVKIEEVTQTIRDVLREASVPGEFGVMGKAKGSTSRRSHSITKNRNLRGTSGAPNFQAQNSRGRPRAVNKKALPAWQTLKTLADTTSL